jgi:FKBP-type peptidyl-prolyl cis-trans isomerase
MKNIILIVIILVVIAVLVQFVVKSPSPDKELPIGEVPTEIIPQDPVDSSQSTSTDTINPNQQQATQSMTPPAGSEQVQMTTTASGLQYGIITQGTGQEVKSGDTVTVHYTGTLVDGREFDSSVSRGQPAQFPIGVGQLIRGWDEGIPGMKVGEKRILVVPGSLAYGSNPPPGSIIGKDETLVFQVEVLATQSR